MKDPLASGQRQPRSFGRAMNAIGLIGRLVLAAFLVLLAVVLYDLGNWVFGSQSPAGFNFLAIAAFGLLLVGIPLGLAMVSRRGVRGTRSDDAQAGSPEPQG